MTDNQPQGEIGKLVTLARNKTLEESFIAACMRDGKLTTVFLVNGIKLQGYVAAFDSIGLVLMRDAVPQFIYRHAISTVAPGYPLTYQPQQELQS